MALSPSPAPTVLGIALGETEAAADRFVAARYPGGRVRWLDRWAVRRAPLRSVLSLWRARFDEVVLFAPDLGRPRTRRLMALLAALPPARRRWLADERGEVEPFALGQHLRQHGWAILRHLTGASLAMVLARPGLTMLSATVALERRLGMRRLHASRYAPRRSPPAGGKHPGPARQPRVLYLRSQFWFGLQGGGSVAHTAGVIDGLRAAGAAVEVVSSDRLRGVSATVHVQPPEYWFDGRAREVEELAYNGPFIARALRVARVFEPTVLYQRYTAFNLAGLVLSRLLRVPLVLEFNSSDVWKGRHWGELHALDLAHRAEQLQLQAADRVVVVSRVLGEDLVAAGVPAGKVVVNPNGVDTDRFSPRVSGADVRASHGLGEALVVGFSGTFGVWHGIATLAAMLPRVLAARPEVRFLLIGDGPLRPLVDRLVREHRLERQVVCPGLVPHESMPGYLAACDVLLSPHGRQADGREFFGSPTKLFEYMAMGRAIVASDLGQIGEVLQHESTALLVRPEDVSALAEAVIRLVDEPMLRERLGASARAQAERDHTWRRNAERVLQSLALHAAPAPPADPAIASPPLTNERTYAKCPRQGWRRPPPAGGRG